ncbi:ABC transporter ATP-binding protein [Olsenella sp. An293]|uniref:ABC transporter ATP-binding protein n=1 Tax=Olsenella sp. An293 TaxID=1965626 RepID=UPI000B39278F|nr:ABC transporter ATP-binding protein [Olsenella sp. An293]OUO33280.1 ABC transporter [Olsenella sp. An293]
MDGVRLIARYLGPYRKDFLVAVLCVAVETSLELVIPMLMANVVDDGILTGDLDAVVVNGGLMLVLAFFSLALGFLYARFSARAAMGLGARLREAEYAHVQEFSFANLDDFESSSLVTRLTTDVTVIQNALVSGTRPLVRGPVILVMGLLFAAVMSAELAVVFFVVMPVLAVAMFLVVRRVGPLYRVLQGTMDQLNDALQEDLAAIRVIKAYVREGHVAERFEAVNGKLASTATHTFRTAVLNTPIFQGTMYTTCVGILWFGGQMILAGTLQVGTFTGFMSYVLQIVNSLMMISNVFLLLARAVTSIERVGEVLDERPTIASLQGALAEVPDGSVRFDHVSFKYASDAEKDVLEDICLDLPAGSTVGVLGGTGSGKTTLVQLIARLYDATSGSVSVGGHDVRAYDLAALRDAVGVVLQKNVLFSGTVRENLAWGDPAATDGQMLEACRLACADEFLDRIGGLDGDLGQGGAGVSGGQRQRLCIARALLKHPRVLIFDDSTSAVDMATDAQIRANLARLTGVTKIVIAQRVASVMDSDLIVVLDDGRVHAVGTHDELLARDNIYQEIYESQIGSGISGEVA